MQATTTFEEPVLPFRLSHGYLIVVEGEIGTLAHLKFILDTGATVTIVDSRIASKLKVSHQPTESFNFDRTLRWEEAIFPEIHFGPVKRTDMVALVGNLAHYSEYAADADAVIGLDFLRSSNFTVDYAAGKIVFHAVGEDAAVNANNAAPNLIVLKIQVQGQPVRLLVDTGFPGVLLFEERLLESVPGLVLARTDPRITMGRRLHARESTLKRVSIGRTTGDVRVLVTQSPSVEVLQGLSGMIGIAALHATRVNFDFSTGLFSWD